MIIVKILLITIIAYFFFVIGPSLGGIIATTSRKNPKSLLEKDLTRGQYKDVQKEITADIQFFDALKSEAVQIETGDKVTLCGTFYDQGSEKTVLMMHGYRALPLNNLASSGRFFYENGYNVLMTVQRGHSISGGRFTTFGPKERDDVFDWIRFLKKEKKIKDLVLFGASMGATTISYASADLKKEDVKAMVLDSGFSSPYTQLVRDCKNRFMPYFLMLPVMCVYGKVVLHVDFKKKIEDSLGITEIPAFFMHGKKDRTVPYKDTENSFTACHSEKDIYLVEGAGHTMSMLIGGMDLQKKLLSFLNKHV